MSASTAQIKVRIYDAIKRRGLSRVVYFHTDHFEPWRSYDGQPVIGERNADEIWQFATAMQGIDFARRLTLFYKTPFNFTMRDGADVVRAGQDRIGFVLRSAAQQAIARSIMTGLVSETRHDIQLHVHHENFTYNTRSLKDPAFRAYLSTPEGRGCDDARLEFAIRLYLASLRDETGLPFDRWFFVHGHWALNASDEHDCCITREIEILKNCGCLGDFTFPAGRSHVDPRYDRPFLVAPFDAPKGYDRPEAQPEAAFGAGPGARGKFFIWSSKIRHVSTSIDYLSPFVRKRAEAIEESCLDLVENSYAENGTLYLKTHAHAMHPGYFETARSPVFPHQYPSTQAIFSLIFDAAAAAGAEVAFLSAGEVYDEMLAGPYQPALEDVAAKPSAMQRLFQGRAGAEKDAGSQPDGRPAPAGALSAADAATAPATLGVLDTFEAQAVETLSRRLAVMGERESGCYNYYATRLARNEALAGYEKEIIAFLARRFSPDTAFVEVGSGVGILPLALATLGYRAGGAEHDGRRHRAGEDILAAMVSRDARYGDLVRLSHSSFPHDYELFTPKTTVAVVSNFIATLSPVQVDEIMRGLAGFKALLIDLDRFGEYRNTGDERAELLQRFAAVGLPKAELVLDLGSEGTYYLLTPDPDKPPPNPWVFVPPSPKRPKRTVRGPERSRLNRFWRRVRKGFLERIGRMPPPDGRR